MSHIPASKFSFSEAIEGIARMIVSSGVKQRLDDPLVMQGRAFLEHILNTYVPGQRGGFHQAFLTTSVDFTVVVSCMRCSR